MAGASDEFRARHRHSHNRDVRERRFFDVESMMNELRSGGSAGNGEDGAHPSRLFITLLPLTHRLPVLVPGIVNAL